MSVYVDKLRRCQLRGRWKWSEACHLVADTEDELHAFAQRLGCKREWAQRTRLVHYDLTKPKRAKAVRYGAIEITDKQFVMMMRPLP